MTREEVELPCKAWSPIQRFIRTIYCEKIATLSVMTVTTWCSRALSECEGTRELAELPLRVVALWSPLRSPVPARARVLGRPSALSA